MKNSSPRDLICYCFNYSTADIRADLARNGRSLIMEKITAAKKARGCDCAVKNPKGRWCLADVRRVVDQVKGSR